MRVVKILFFFFLIGLGQLKAQTNFVKGYYITPALDTIHGYLECRFESRNFDYCVFKEDLTSSPVTFRPQDITGFAFENKDFYEKHAFKNRKGEELNGFFKVLLRGDISLLRYRSKYFAKDHNAKIFEISQHEEVVDGRVRKDYIGLGSLRVMMKDCEQAADYVLKYKPDDEEEFRAAFEKYYQCKGTNPARTEKVHIKPHADFGVLGSVAMMRLHLGGPFTDVGLGNVTTFSAGGYASFFLPRIDERLHMVVEATYTKYKNYAYFSVNGTNNDLYINYSALRIPLLARYSTKVLFFDLGLQTQLILANDPRWRVETMFSDKIYTTDVAAKMMPNFTLGYLLGAGVKYNIAGHAMRSSVRFSKVTSRNLENVSACQTVELMLSIQLTR